MSKTEEARLRRNELAWIMGNKCHVCHKKYGKNFHFHHIRYLDTDKKHSDFASNVDYNLYVYQIILHDQGRFALLCRNCHFMITAMQQIKDHDRFVRLVTLAEASRPPCDLCGAEAPYHKGSCRRACVV